MSDDQHGSEEEHSAMNSAQKAKVPWTHEEDEKLRKAVEQYKGRGWKQVAELLPGRTHSQAAHRWQKVLDPKLKKGAWTPEEDVQLQKAVDELGEGHWSRVAEKVGSRNGKQCRERWRNQISPDVDKRPWSPEEDEGIVRMYNEIGPKWAEIAKVFPGRTENAVKNRWNAKLGRPHTASPSSRKSSKSYDIKPRLLSQDELIPKMASLSNTSPKKEAKSTSAAAAGLPPTRKRLKVTADDKKKKPSTPVQTRAKSSSSSVKNGTGNDSHQLDATQALLALKASSPGWKEHQ